MVQIHLRGLYGQKGVIGLKKGGYRCHHCSIQAPEFTRAPRQVPEHREHQEAVLISRPRAQIGHEVGLRPNKALRRKTTGQEDQQIVRQGGKSQT